MADGLSRERETAGHPKATGRFRSKLAVSDYSAE